MSLRKSLFALSFLLVASLVVCAQPTHPNSPHDTLRTKNLTVTYGRPYKKGREIFGKLEPYGKVYRCGADEATTITFMKDGTYSLFVIPNEDKWTIILNGQAKQWGAYDYEKNKAKDVLHVDVPVTKLNSVVEQLTIALAAKNLTIAWDQTQVAIPVSF